MVKSVGERVPNTLGRPRGLGAAGEKARVTQDSVDEQSGGDDREETTDGDWVVVLT